MTKLTFEWSRDQLGSLPASKHSGAEGAAAEVGDLVFALVLDGAEAPPPEFTPAQKALDWIVQAAQPAPASTHIELLFVPEAQKEAHFATYLGSSAGFGSSFPNKRQFYLGANAGNWRAIPIVRAGVAKRVRLEALNHAKTPYSLARYVCAVPPLRAFAGILRDEPLDPAHCATLTARVLRRAVPELKLEHASAWYGPTTLALELASDAATAASRESLGARGALDPTDAAQDVGEAMHALIHGTDEDVRGIAPERAARAVRVMAARALEEGLDVVGRGITQKQLATALLRLSCATE